LAAVFDLFLKVQALQEKNALTLSYSTLSDAFLRYEGK
jgi:hypothetical protein